MYKKGLLALSVIALAMASCANEAPEKQTSQIIEPSDTQSVSYAYGSSSVEEADPLGYDPNFDYVGTSALDFKLMASMYVAEPEFVPEPDLRDRDYINRPYVDFGIITFPFRGSSVLAYHRGNKILEVHRFQSGKMTISEARTLGYVGDEQANQSVSDVYFTLGGKASTTKRYEKALEPNLGNINHEDVQGHDLGVSGYLDLFTKYGIPTSLFVYFDGFADDYVNDIVGHGWAGLAVDSASAIPIYSDDLRDVVGAMTLGFSSQIVKKVFTYLKEDGFGTVKKAKDIIAQICNPDFEKVQDPCFYFEDTSVLPKGDWRMILGTGN